VTRSRGSFLFAGLRWLLVAAWAGVIWKLLTLPAEETPDVSFIPSGDKLGHVAVYCIWGLLISWAVTRSFREPSRLAVGVAVVLAGTAYGVISEIYQAQIGRDPDLLDVAADTAGALLAQFLYFSPKINALLKRVISRRMPRSP
jgi:VanZ family protein